MKIDSFTSYIIVVAIYINSIQIAFSFHSFQERVRFKYIKRFANKVDAEKKPTPWFEIDGRKIRRFDIEELQIGQKLEGIKLDQDLLAGKTGPKVFLDCGVAKYDPKKDRWSYVNGMLRLGSKWDKQSVMRKKAARLGKQTSIELFVSRIFPESGTFEVSTNSENLQTNIQKRVPASSLQINQEVTGTVKRVEAYGVFVDVGANRLGLLHIKKVSNHFGFFIDKENGLETVGLEKGAEVRLKVESNEKKRLFLDFIQKEEIEVEDDSNQEKLVAIDNDESSSDDSQMSEEDLAAWAAFAAADDYEDDYNQLSDEDAAAWASFAEESYDDDDEDKQIEDALGLGSY